MGVHFINPGAGYAHLVSMFVWAIAKHLPPEVEVSVGAAADPLRFNVHFFREETDVFGRPRECCDLYISHGILQKVLGTTVERLSQFDYIGVPGPMAADCLAARGVERAKMVTVGHPGLDEAFRWHQAFASDPALKEFYGQHVLRDARLAAKNPKPVVLWAPSHSAFIGEYVLPPLYFSKALDAAHEIVRVGHPAVSGRSSVLARDVLHFAKACIGDVSGTVFEAWALGVPVVFPDWLIGEFVVAQCGDAPLGRVYSEGIGRHVQSPEDFPAAVREAVNEGITEEEKRFIDSYLPVELRGSSGKAAAAFLRRVRRAWVMEKEETDASLQDADDRSGPQAA